MLALGLLATCFAIGRVAAQSDGIKTGTFPFADIDVYYQMKETDNKGQPAVDAGTLRGLSAGVGAVPSVPAPGSKRDLNSDLPAAPPPHAQMTPLYSFYTARPLPATCG